MFPAAIRKPQGGISACPLAVQLPLPDAPMVQCHGMAELFWRRTTGSRDTRFRMWQYCAAVRHAQPPMRGQAHREAHSAPKHAPVPTVHHAARNLYRSVPALVCAPGGRVPTRIQDERAGRISSSIIGGRPVRQSSQGRKSYQSRHKACPVSASLLSRTKARYATDITRGPPWRSMGSRFRSPKVYSCSMYARLRPVCSRTHRSRPNSRVRSLSGSKGPKGSASSRTDSQLRDFSPA